MTVNDITKVDFSLKERPSRFKYCIEFSNPSLELVQSLLGQKENIDEVAGMNLDQILTIKNYIEKGISTKDAIDKIPNFK